MNPTCEILHGFMCVIPQDTGKSIMCDGFLGRVVDLALYETNVLNP